MYLEELWDTRTGARPAASPGVDAGVAAGIPAEETAQLLNGMLNFYGSPEASAGYARFQADWPTHAGTGDSPAAKLFCAALPSSCIAVAASRVALRIALPPSSSRSGAGGPAAGYLWPWPPHCR